MSAPWAEVIGTPIAHSKSPLLHRFWLDRLGLAGDYRRTEVAGDALAGFLAARRAEPGWCGCNVTLPHKQAVLPLLDRLDDQAARIGAVNTVVREGDRLIGYNTDAPGFLEPLTARLAQPHLLRTARLFGTGGAARAIAWALKDQGFVLVLVGRSEARAAALAEQLGGGPDIHVAALDRFAAPFRFDWGDGVGRFDLAVNATTLGMAGQPPLPLDLSHLAPGTLCYDAVYAPLLTPFLAAACAAGHPVVDGLAMLVGQARAAFRRFFGVAAPNDPASDAALRTLLTA